MKIIAVCGCSIHWHSIWGCLCWFYIHSHIFNSLFFNTNTVEWNWEKSRWAKSMQVLQSWSSSWQSSSSSFYFCLQCWGFWGCKTAQKLFMREKLKSWINRLKNHEGGEKKSFAKFVAVAMIIKVQYLERKNQWELGIDAKLILDFVVKMLFWGFFVWKWILFCSLLWYWILNLF